MWGYYSRPDNLGYPAQYSTVERKNKKTLATLVNTRIIAKLEPGGRHVS
jgi:hypothetical protein